MLARYAPTRVVASSYDRARDTLAPLARRLGLPLELDPELRERNLGAWVPDFEAAVRQAWEHPDQALPGGETNRQATDRITAALIRLVDRYPGERIAVATHGTVLAAFLHRFDPSFDLEAWKRLGFPDVVRVFHDGSGFRRDPDFRPWRPPPTEDPTRREGLAGRGILDAVEAEVAALAEPEADPRNAPDPYWPKWTSTWWRASLLDEMGLSHRLPASVVEGLATVLDRHYLRTFPLPGDSLPAGIDPRRQVLCHCALGNLARVLWNAGVDLDARMPWIRDWLLGYQLPDGGWNCDESACTPERPRSSFLSTAPCLELLVRMTERPFTPSEEGCLRAAAGYLGSRRLHRSLRSGRVANPAWAHPVFPRFYHYDVLRGLSALESIRPWIGDEHAPASAEARSLVAAWLSDRARPRTRDLAREGSIAPPAWERGPAEVPRLLALVADPGLPSPWLEDEARGVMVAGS